MVRANKGQRVEFYEENYLEVAGLPDPQGHNRRSEKPKEVTDIPKQPKLDQRRGRRPLEL